MFFTVSRGVKELAASMIENPGDWVQGTYEFFNTTYPDIRIWTANGATFLRIGGNACLSLAEKFYLAKAMGKMTTEKTS